MVTRIILYRNIEQYRVVVFEKWWADIDINVFVTSHGLSCNTSSTHATRATKNAALEVATKDDDSDQARPRKHDGEAQSLYSGDISSCPPPLSSPVAFRYNQAPSFSPAPIALRR